MNAEDAVLMNVVVFISVQPPHKDQEFSPTHFCVFNIWQSGQHTTDLGTGFLN